MGTVASRVKGIFFILGSLLLCIGVCALFYFYSIEQKAEYQNQLQLRELRAVEKNLNSGISLLKEAVDTYKETPETTRFEGMNGKKIFSSAAGALKRGEWRLHPGKAYQHVTVTQELDVGGEGVTAFQRLSRDLVAAVPFSDLVGSQIHHHSVLLVTDLQGNVLIRKDNKRLDANPSSFTLQNMKALVNGGDTDDKNIRLPGTSGFINRQIADKEYRLYFSAYSNREFIIEGDESNALFIIGIKSLDEFKQDSLQIPHTVAAFAILLVLMFLCLLPLIKIRLISPAQSLSQFEIKLCVYGLFLFIGLGTIFTVFAITLPLEYRQIKTESKAIAIQMRAHFRQEVSTVLDEVSHFLQKNRQALIFSGRDDGAYSDWEIDETPKNRETSEYHPRFPHLEGVFLLEEDNIMKNVFWSDSSFFRCKQNTQPNTVCSATLERISLERRDYVRRAWQDELWTLTSDVNAKRRGDGVTMSTLFTSDNAFCNPQGEINKGSCRLFIQRLFNKRDSRLSSQFSTLLKLHSEEDDEAASKAYVASFGTKFASFFRPVLTPGFEFLVFQKQTGEVLFHSDESRVLNEDIFVQTDNNPELTQIVSAGLLSSNAISLDTYYHGRETMFTVIELDPGIPWTLVVFQDLTNQRALFFLRIITVIVYFLLFTLFVILVWEVVNSIRKVRYRSLFSKALAGYYQRHGFGEIASSYYAAVFCVFFGGTAVALTAVFLFSSSNTYVSALSKIFTETAQQRLSANIVKTRNYQTLMFGEERAAMAEYMAPPPLFSGAIALKEGSKAENRCDVIIEKPERRSDFFSRAATLFYSLISLSRVEAELSDQLRVIKHYFEDSSTSGSPNKEINRCEFDILAVGETPQTPLFWLCCVTLLCGATFLCLTFPIIRFWFVQRVLGLHVPLHFRAGVADVCANLDSPRRLVIRQPEEIDHSSGQVEDADPPDNERYYRINIASLVGDIAKNTNYNQRQSLTFSEVDAFFKSHSIFGDWLNSSAVLYLTLYGIEGIAFSQRDRKLALAVLQALNIKHRLVLTLECEVAPLYRLTHQTAYPHTNEADKADVSEIYSWSQLFAGFEKCYAWNPVVKSGVFVKRDTQKILDNEATGWPELASIKARFLIYHREFKSRTADSETFKKVREVWLPEQIIEYFSAEAGALYRQRWELCTRQERLLLFQIASGQQPNPLNKVPLEHLVRRGYLYRDSQWQVINRSFADFVLCAEPNSQFVAWLADSKDNTWRYFRLPLYAVLIAVIAILVYAATDSIQTFVAILSGVLGLIPMALSNLNMIKDSTSDLSG